MFYWHRRNLYRRLNIPLTPSKGELNGAVQRGILRSWAACACRTMQLLTRRARQPASAGSPLHSFRRGGAAVQQTEQGASASLIQPLLTLLT